MAKSNSAMAGRWAFIIGVILAVLAGLVTIPWSATILFILGLVVGFLNVSDKESTGFLIAVTALLLIGVAGISTLNNINVVGGFTDMIVSILEQFIAFIAAAGLVVGLKAVIASAQR
jgi:uncharacterized membrane protein